MPNLTLGGVTFYIYELPEKINFGGEQTLAVRKFPGGGLDIQPLGAFDDEISWSGTFQFTGAKDRLMKIGMMRVNAQPVLLQISFIKRTVVVKKFTYDYINDTEIPYQITLQPFDDGTFNGLVQSNNAQGQNIVNQTSQTTAATTKQTPTYIVTSKDTLWGIAQKQYKDGSKWTLIAQANNIKNPGALIPGTKLTIPSLG